MALPYLQPASSGTFQRTSYVPQVYTSSRPTTGADIEAARQAQIAGRLSYGNNMPAGVQLSQVRQGWMDNGNPEWQGGTVEANIGGQIVRVPNALVQSMMATDAYNQGRSNQMGQFFGGNANPNAEVYKYSDMGATQGRFDKILADNPQWNVEGSLNPYKRAQEQSQQAGAEYGRLQAESARPITETRNAMGVIQGVDVVAQREEQRRAAQEKARRMAAAVPQTRGDRIRGAEQATSSLRHMEKAFGGGVQRTYSNVPIRETYIR